MSKKCRNCGSDLADNAKFCDKCGTRAINDCSKCGTILGEEDMFCPNCGHATGIRKTAAPTQDPQIALIDDHTEKNPSVKTETATEQKSAEAMAEKESKGGSNFMKIFVAGAVIIAFVVFLAIYSDTRKTVGIDQESSSEMLNRGVMYYDKGSEALSYADYAEALKWFNKAADLGNANAMYNIGLLYHEGNGVVKNPAEAEKWYKKAADRGNVSAMKYFGWYYYGYGGSRNPAEALKWFKKAANHGDAVAMNTIGLMYVNGYGVARDYVEAIKWFKKAADLGYAQSMRNLAHFIERGLGVPKNEFEAARWREKADAAEGKKN